MLFFDSTNHFNIDLVYKDLFTFVFKNNVHSIELAKNISELCTVVCMS